MSRISSTGIIRNGNRGRGSMIRRMAPRVRVAEPMDTVSQFYNCTDSPDKSWGGQQRDRIVTREDARLTFTLRSRKSLDRLNGSIWASRIDASGRHSDHDIIPDSDTE